MKGKAKIYVNDWGKGHRYEDNRRRFYPVNETLLIPEEEVERFMWDDYDRRLAKANRWEKEFVPVLHLQEVMNDLDDREYNNDRRHRRGLRHLSRLSAFLEDREEMMVPRERECLISLARKSNMVGHMASFMTAGEMDLVRELFMARSMTRREYGERHHLSCSQVDYCIRKIREKCRNWVTHESLMKI